MQALYALFALTTSIQPAHSQTIDEAFMAKRFPIAEGRGDLAPEAKAKLDQLLVRDLKELSDSPNWTPRHPKWSEIEQAYRAEFEGILKAAAKLNGTVITDVGGKLVRLYRTALSEREQTEVVAFYAQPLGQRFLRANEEIAGLVEDVGIKFHLTPDALRASVRPLAPEKQARWAAIVNLTDTVRIVGALMERKLSIDGNAASATIQTAFSVHGSEFEAVRSRFTDDDLRLIAVFQESQAGRKELSIVSDYFFQQLIAYQAEIQQRIERGTVLLSRWRNSAELR